MREKTDNPVIIKLWNNTAVPNAGAETSYVDTLGYERKTFYLKSDKSGVISIRVYDEQADDMVEIDSIVYTTPALLAYLTLYGSRRMALLFDPAADSITSCWVVLE